MGVELFLSAYDPLDLPSGSIDPLGFERGYLILAEKLLPGLTNVADRPRYFSVLCAGAYLADKAHGEGLRREPPRKQYEQRHKYVLRMERLWALACVLAAEQNGQEPAGLRGVTYAKNRLEILGKQGRTSTTPDYKLLSRQTAYGVLGIYGTVAENLRLLDKKTLNLTPALGWTLAEGFLKETKADLHIRTAVMNGSEVGLAKLANWGARVHINGDFTPTEARCLAIGLRRDHTRFTMAELLARHPYRDQKEDDLSRLQRVFADVARRGGEYAYFVDTISCILAYEQAYRWAQLGFERMLWLCRRAPAGRLPVAELAADPVFARVRREMPQAAADFLKTRAACTTDELRQELGKLDDVGTFLRAAAACSAEARALAGEILARHRDVQRGKFEHGSGRGKLPWIESSGDGHLQLTSARVGGLGFEARALEDISGHPYRLAAADELYRATRWS
ncbi:MAG: hypothetical protein DRI34_06325 [Deltaproteobacteria bacterium]|nr:MAG: hypothetical protein DRI34_06325 [Deltaproteobacteria bacterium]